MYRTGKAVRTIDMRFQLASLILCDGRRLPEKSCQSYGCFWKWRGPVIPVILYDVRLVVLSAFPSSPGKSVRVSPPLYSSSINGAPQYTARTCPHRSCSSGAGSGSSRTPARESAASTRFDVIGSRSVRDSHRSLQSLAMQSLTQLNIENMFSESCIQ